MRQLVLQVITHAKGPADLGHVVGHAAFQRQQRADLQVLVFLVRMHLEIVDIGAIVGAAHGPDVVKEDADRPRAGLCQCDDRRADP
ncbi:MAG TPA: hypothetical protein VHJ58_16520, partial [Vicinamibacterales bacterium]|nr:hypothetical protein [Vicinamibacterales bacterium]